MPLLNELYQEIIIDHSTSPRNEGNLDLATHSTEVHNVTCGDELAVSLFVSDDLIRDIKFRAQGCSISKASGSMMTEKVKGISVSEAIEFSKKLQKMLNNSETHLLDEETIGDLVALLGVKRFPMRVKCATLPWHALERALQSPIPCLKV
ncbi:MAG: SUF system NifU family Fe-S cluster assembly protein [Puniceicoccales bacterium]|jgi:nitrogen fixation NifU-like protein|nr:SUF system NifU family Fe-S cluster assembly protein [Puniceicoccales bacterium]